MTQNNPQSAGHGKSGRPARILIAAGGSGGHIFPAIALGRALKGIRSDAEILFVGSSKALDKRLFDKESARYSTLSDNKMPYKPSARSLGFMLKLLFDISKSFSIMMRFRPDVVVGFGGYISFPVMAAAYTMRVPKVAHEQNAVPGRANKAIFALADRVAVSFDETRGRLGKRSSKAVLTGNPIRTDIFNHSRENGIKRFGLESQKFTVLVIGGSQGANFLNRTFVESLSAMDPDEKRQLQVIHITGVKDYEWAMNAYKDSGVESRVHSFIDRIEEAYAASDLVITRSGASALFELAYLGKPMVLVPYPFAMSHQAQNAAAFSDRSAAVVLEEKSLSARTFKDTITGLMRDRSRLERLGASAKSLSAPDASQKLAGAVLEYVK